MSSRLTTYLGLIALETALAWFAVRRARRTRGSVESVVGYVPTASAVARDAMIAAL